MKEGNPHRKDQSEHLPALTALKDVLGWLQDAASKPGVGETVVTAGFLANPFFGCASVALLAAARLKLEKQKGAIDADLHEHVHELMLDPIKATHEIFELSDDDISKQMQEGGIHTGTPLVLLFKKLRENGGKLDELGGKIEAAQGSLNSLERELEGTQNFLMELDEGLKSSLHQLHSTLASQLHRVALEIPAEIQEELRLQTSYFDLSLKKTSEDLKEFFAEKVDAQHHPTLYRYEGNRTSDQNLNIDALRFDRQWLDFIGREEDLGSLWDWMLDDLSFSWWAVIGEGGMGKSRLALRLIEQAHRAGWRAGFLGKRGGVADGSLSWIADENAYRNWRPKRHTLLVIDYASLQGERILRLLHEIQVLHEEGELLDREGVKVRILCLDRPGALPNVFPPGLDGRMLPGLQKSCHLYEKREEDLEKAGEVRSEHFPDAHFHEMEGLSVESWFVVLAKVYESHGKEFDSSRYTQDDVKSLYQHTSGTPLYLQLAGEILATEKGATPTSLGKNELLDEMLFREIRASDSRWRDLTGMEFEEAGHDDLRAFVGLLTLIRNADFSGDEDKELFQELLGDSLSEEVLGQARKIVGAGEEALLLPGIQPDLLAGRFLLLGGVPKKQTLFGESVEGFDGRKWLGAVLQAHPRRVMQSLELLARDFWQEPEFDRWREDLLKLSKERDHATPEMADLFNLLYLKLDEHARFKEAEPLIRRALAIDESSYGEDHPNVARDLNNLASLLQATNRLEEAEPLMRRALAIDESSYGEDHPNVATALNNLASLLQATNRLEEAEPLMRRALAIDESSYGEDHPEVATDLNNLASLLKATNRLEEAEEASRRQVIIFVRYGMATGHEHPHFRTSIANYLGLLSAMELGQEEIAKKLVSLGPEAGVEQDEWMEILRGFGE